MGAAVLNRSAFFVWRDDPFLIWMAGAPGPPDRGEGYDEGMYLVPFFRTVDEGLELLRGLHPIIFKRQLKAWCHETSTWPVDRSFEQFQRWFRVEMHSELVDLALGQIWDAPSVG